MARTFHCSYNTLKTICEGEPSWRLKVLQSFDSIHVKEDKDYPPLSEEDYIRMTRGDISAPEYIGDIRADLDTLQKQYNLPRTRLSSCMDIHDIDRHANDVVMAETLNDLEDFPPSGIIILSKTDFLQLKRRWDDRTYKDDAFCWNTFFTRTIPTSNSIMIIDRYLFQSFPNCRDKYLEEGTMNAADILYKAIPNDFNGEYRILFVFDRKQIETNGNTLSISEAVKKIDLELRTSLRKKPCNLRIEYLVVWDSKFQGKSLINREQHDFFLDTHDRIILSNYYEITATHAFAASRDKFRKKATHTQKIAFRTFFDGIDQPDQKFEFIPIKGETKMLKRFVKDLNKVPDDKLLCYCTTTESTGLQNIKKTELKNRVLDIVKTEI